MTIQPAMKRYVIIGLAVYIFELVVILVTQKFGGGPVLAVGLSFWLGMVVSFMLQKVVAFEDRRIHHKVLLPQIAAFSLLVLFNFGFTLLVTKLLATAVPATLTRTLALGLTTIWNFYLYKTRIFKPAEGLVF